MKLARFMVGNEIKFGVVEEEVVMEIQGDLFGDHLPTGVTYPLVEIKLLSPVTPGKMIAVGLNYKAHAEEKQKDLPDEPMVFMVSPTAIVGPGDEVVLPYDHLVEHEAELVAVIGREGRDIPEENALDYVLGYTCGNDVSDRELQKKDRQFTRAKSFHTFKPLGPYLASGLDPGDLKIQCWLNGKLKQDSTTALFIHSVAKLISFTSQIMTLYPGDVIFTGTPAGVSPIRDGDVMEVYVEGVGVLTNPVVMKNTR
ncbi:hypothetical protein SY88_15545 [Clostridiales bacterium PH28_bin88]|nr:hypothetical protein SY88_15545 [Clostridiales bacterium PH28_bin88]